MDSLGGDFAREVRQTIRHALARQMSDARAAREGAWANWRASRQTAYENRKNEREFNRVANAQFARETRRLRREAARRAFERRQEARRERARARSLRARDRAARAAAQRAPDCVRVTRPGCPPEAAACFRSCSWPGRLVCDPRTQRRFAEEEIVRCGACCKAECRGTWGQWLIQRAEEVLSIEGPTGTSFVTAPVAAGFFAAAAAASAAGSGPTECPPVVQGVVAVFPWAAFGPCCGNPSGCAHTSF